MHIKTVILLGNFFYLVCVMLLICQQCFLFNVFYFCHKNAFFNVFYSWAQRFFTSMLLPDGKYLMLSYQNLMLKSGFQCTTLLKIGERHVHGLNLLKKII